MDVWGGTDTIENESLTFPKARSCSAGDGQCCLSSASSLWLLSQRFVSLKSLGFEAVLIGDTTCESHVEDAVRTGWDLGSPGVCSNLSLAILGAGGPSWAPHTLTPRVPGAAHTLILLPSLQQVPSCLRV